ncbi:MAG: sigma-54-dependent Fis family transcriptional regulator [Lentisphaerae bacterium]|nr:sigma-54-dependent Fis family transcriptional regulator [Lentisphaerota bacterium]
MPQPIVDELRRLCVDRRHPAYVQVAADGTIRGQGGEYERYGIGTLAPDEPVGHQLDYLEGMLPLSGEAVFLPLVQVMPEVYADLHLFPSDDGDYVLLLDATAQAYHLFDIQQNANELSLLRRQQTNLIAEIRKIQGDLLAVLNQLQIVTAIVNERGDLEFLSASAERLLSGPVAEALGRPWERVLPITEEDKLRVRELLQAPLGQRRRITLNAVTHRGRHFAFELDVRDDPRMPAKRILCLYDVTEVYDLRQLLEDKARLHELIGASDAMHEVFQLIRDVAAVDATVLIEGETGTGKELVARAIHASSHRKDKPLIVVNSAGLSDSLINSQLFGHKKGAFTDASSDQEGFFEAADGGTIFLDEIGDIPMNTQTRILRALEQKEVMRIGETKARKVDVRIIAATNKSLNDEVARGNFRLDLLYRLRIARINLPPLRVRTDDIPLLVSTFLKQSRAATGKQIDEIDQDAMRAFVDYRWPGNVRELKNAISFAAIHCKGPIIRVKDLPPELTEGPSRFEARRDAGTDTEKERILRALESAGGNRGEAARMLGIGRATLYRRMKACMIIPGDLPKSAQWKPEG